MRCPGCNKFAAYDEPQVELDSEDLDGQTVKAEVRIVLQSECCGEELAELNEPVEIEFEHDCAEPDKALAEGIEPYEITASEGTAIDRMEKKTRIFGAELSFTVKCNRCGEDIAVHYEIESPANGFDSLVD